jgi:hypothetical protein
MSERQTRRARSIWSGSGWFALKPSGTRPCRRASAPHGWRASSGWRSSMRGAASRAHSSSGASVARSAKRSKAAPDWRAPRNSPGAADFQVAPGDLEPVGRLHHGLEPRPGGLAQPRRVAGGIHQHAGRRRRTAADPSAQLVQLRQAETLRVFDHHQRGIGHVHADLDHRGADQHAHPAADETLHHRLLVGHRHARMQQADLDRAPRAPVECRAQSWHGFRWHWPGPAPRSPRSAGRPNTPAGPATSWSRMRAMTSSRRASLTSLVTMGVRPGGRLSMVDTSRSA